MAALSNLITPTNIITASNSLTLTNKTISGASNTLTNIPLATAVTGTLPIANGGTGTTTRQDAMDALAGAVTSGFYLRGNGADVVMTAIQAGDVPTLNQNTTGTASNVTGTVAVANGGTGATTAAAARTNLGATTVGGNLLTLTNPSAITFPRFNADNTVSALDAATFRSAIGAGTSSTTGTVTSVSATAGTGISITGSPITSSGTLNITNTGVTSLTAGTGISLSGSTGSITVTASGGSSYVYLGRVAFAQGTGNAQINLPANWWNTYDAIYFVAYGTLFTSGFSSQPGYLLINNSTANNYNYGYGKGDTASNQSTSNNIYFPMQCNGVNTSQWNCTGIITASYYSSGQNFWAANVSMNYSSTGNSTGSGWLCGTYYVPTGGTTISTINWYNGGYNATTSLYWYNGAFTAWGLKNS